MTVAARCRFTRIGWVGNGGW